MYILIEKYLKKKKLKRVIKNNLDYGEKFNSIIELPFFLKKYFLKVKKQLSDLDYPYNLKFKNYLILKYIFSVLCLIISIINKNNIIISIFIFILIFYMPNFLIMMFKKNEKILIIKELRNISNSIIIALSASVQFEEAIKKAGVVISSKRLRKAYDKFVIGYKLSEYDLKKSVILLNDKFNYYEMELFTSTLVNSESEGNSMQSLIKYNQVLDISYSKYLAAENSKRLMYVTLGTVISLFNIITIVMYPIFVEVSSNLQSIFK